MPGLINLSRAASLAIHASVMISKSNKRMNAGEIADELKASTHHVSKVLQKLAHAGILNSKKGPLGGFALSDVPSEITLLRVYEAIEGKLVKSYCPEYSDYCPFEKCIWGDFGNSLHDDFKKYMESKTLADFA
jgi:Rrf2 family protein